MESQSTDPAIAAALLQLLRCHHGNLEWTGPHGEVGRAAARQWKVGPADLAEGLLVTDWAALQQQHYRQIRSRRSGQRWASLVSEQLWLLSFSMWEHRNEIHRSSAAFLQQQEGKKLDRKVERQCMRGSAGLPATAQRLFKGPLAMQLAMPNAWKERWLCLVGFDSRRLTQELTECACSNIGSALNLEWDDVKDGP